MEVFSLEEDDGNELFITQESKENVFEMDKSEEESENFLGLDTMDFQSPCSSILSKSDKYQPVCSDISGDDFDGSNTANDGEVR